MPGQFESCAGLAWTTPANDWCEVAQWAVVMNIAGTHVLQNGFAV